jgi:arginyl-tRNA synthetase
MKSDEKHEVFKNLVDALAQATGLPLDQAAAQLGAPPKAGMGDYAFPCFAYAKAKKLNPQAAAQQIAEILNSDPSLKPALASAETAGAFLNIRIHPGELCKSVIGAVRAAAGHYGESDTGAGKTVVIDYSAPNIAKPFHVGHLMSTILGASLARIFRAQGYTVVGVNHLGDWGVQCGFQFLAWRREQEKFAQGQAADPEAQLAAHGLDYLADLYVAINQDAKQDPTLDAQARALFKKLEDGDAELKALWEKLRKATLTQLQKSYDRLGVTFESDAGEGFYEPMLKPLLEKLKSDGIAVESEGALVIPMEDAPPKTEKDKKPPFILLKADEATIYGTRDLAAALYRKKTYDFAKNLYVVDVRQSLHFQQLFKALDRMGHEWSKDCVHVAFGLMSVKDGDQVLAMSTRGGRMVPLGDLLDKMVAVVKEIVRQKNPEIAETKMDAVAEAVGVGAIIYWIQARRRMSNFVFDWQQATDPQGDTGPYLQYTHARACSILRKSGTAPAERLNADLALLVEPEEVAVIRALEALPKVLRQAANDYEPSLVATWALELASAFGHFLNRHRVLDSEPAVRLARLALVETVREILAKGLEMIGVQAPDEM